MKERLQQKRVITVYGCSLMKLNLCKYNGPGHPSAQWGINGIKNCSQSVRGNPDEITCDKAIKTSNQVLADVSSNGSLS